MSKRGVFAVDRGVFDHPMFAPEPFTEREAWLWLISAAAWEPMRVRAGRALVQLDRGQCAFATRFMATKWKWSEARVRRFLNRLKTDAAVTLTTTRETTQISICNYDKYAFGRRTVDAQDDAQTDAPATHPRRKEEELKNLTKGSAPKQAPLFEIASRETPPPPTPDAELYARGKQVLGKTSGGLIASLLKSKGGNIALARAAIEQASTKADAREYIGRIISGPTAANERHGINDPLAGIQ